MEESLILYLQLTSIAVSLVLLLISLKWPNVGRLFFSLIFLYASYINIKTAILDPDQYLNYARFTWFTSYENFIDGFFSHHIAEIVCLIAFSQLLIGILMTTKEKAVVWSGWAAIAFLVGIAPLGVGSGFPSTLIMALAIYSIIRKPINKHLWEFVSARKDI